MSETWITDMSDFDYRDEEVHKFPAKALNLWTYFGSIIEGTVNKLSSRPSTGIPCRRRPGKKPCAGVIESELIPPGNELRWWCPVCADNGQISNWEGTRWAPSGTLSLVPRSGQLFGSELAAGPWAPAPYQIEGTIEWDDEVGDIKIVTPQRTCFWEELGVELIPYEGFRISIKMG